MTTRRQESLSAGGRASVFVRATLRRAAEFGERGAQRPFSDVPCARPRGEPPPRTARRRKRSSRAHCPWTHTTLFAFRWRRIGAARKAPPPPRSQLTAAAPLLIRSFARIQFVVWRPPPPPKLNRRRRRARSFKYINLRSPFHSPAPRMHFKPLQLASSPLERKPQKRSTKP
jgi:hypothetical protein